MKEKKTVSPSYGGMAVLEGVMMQTDKRIVMAVRRKDGSITTVESSLSDFTKKHRWAKWPVIRGVVNLVLQLKMGYGMLMQSGDMMMEDEGEEPESASGGLLGTLSILVAILFSVTLFFLLPSFISGLLLTKGSLWTALLEGVLRIVIFIAYLFACSLMEDMRRVFMYHGAEHKVIYAYEDGQNIEDTKTVQTYSRVHPRCGTSYMFLVMVVSILVFSLFYFVTSPILRVVIRLLMLPLVAGLSYEVLKLAASSNNLLCRLLRYPGLLMQRLTTREPTDDMIEVAATALELAMKEEHN